MTRARTRALVAGCTASVIGGAVALAEHGGAAPQDRDVPLVVSGDQLQHHGAVDGSVETTQIAPTILQLLG